MKPVVDAAAAAKIKHVLWGRLENVEKESKGKWHVPHFTDKAKIADYILTKSFEFVSFPEPAFYYQNWQGFFPPKVVDGKLTFTIPATSNLSMFDVNDTGHAVHMCLAHPHKWGQGNIIPLCGEHCTPQEFLDTFNSVNKTNAVLVQVPVEQFANFGFPGAGEIAQMFGWFDEYTYFGRTAKREDGIRLVPHMKTLREWIFESKFDGQPPAPKK